MNKYLMILLKEMARRVGADFDKLDFDKSDWYMQHEWTNEQQDEFKEWMVNYLYVNIDARKAIVNIPIRTKKHLRKTADEFVFQYGWKLKE